MRKKVTLVDIERAIGLRGSLYDFVCMAWPQVESGTEFKANWHIEEICLHLEAVSDGRIKRLIVNIPPGGMKSLLVSVFWPVWQWIRRPGWRSIHASYDGTLSHGQAKQSLDLLQSAWFVARWGDKVSFESLSPAVGNYHNLAKGWRFSTSVRGPVTGRHADCIIVDDPVKPLEVTALALSTTVEWWRTTLASRLKDPEKTAKVLIMQRVHMNDLAGHCIENEGFENWVVLRLPMRYEAEHPCVTPVGGDRRTEEGELLFPGRFPHKVVESMGMVLGPMGRAAQFQQRPSPEKGAIFSSDWFRYWKEIPFEFDEVIQSWDCAFKGLDTSDWVVGGVWGVKGARYYLLDQVRGKWNFTETCYAIRELSAKWPGAVRKLIEEKANGAAVCDTLQETVDGIVRINPEGGKVVRARAVTGLYEAGNVYHPDPAEHPWVHEFERELLDFPVAKHDDQVDQMTQVLNYLRGNIDYFTAAMEKLESGELTFF